MPKTKKTKRELWSFEIPVFITSSDIARAMFKTGMTKASFVHVHYYYRALAHQSKRVPRFSEEDAVKMRIPMEKIRQAEHALQQAKAITLGNGWIEFVDKSSVLTAQILLIRTYQQANAIFENDPGYKKMKKTRAVEFI